MMEEIVERFTGNAAPLLQVDVLPDPGHEAQPFEWEIRDHLADALQQTDMHGYDCHIGVTAVAGDISHIKIAYDLWDSALQIEKHSQVFYSDDHDWINAVCEARVGEGDVAYKYCDSVDLLKRVLTWDVQELSQKNVPYPH